MPACIMIAAFEEGGPLVRASHASRHISCPSPAAASLTRSPQALRAALCV